MSEMELRDFDLEGEAPGAALPIARPEPIIIVQYRNRPLSGVLVPPALILAVAAVMVAYRPELPIWFAGPRPVAPRPGSIPSEQAPAPVVLEVRALPAEPQPPAGLQEPTEAEEPEAVASRELAAAEPLEEPEVVSGEAAIRPSLPQAEVVAAPPPPPVDPAAVREQALAEIRREAERVRARQAEAEALQARRAEVELAAQLQARRAAERQAREARQRAEQVREEFRDGLVELLRRFGDQAGPQILALAAQYNEEPGARIEAAITRDLRSRAGRLSRAQRVALLRAHGLSEPQILGDLVFLETRRAPAVPRRAVGNQVPGVDFDAVVRAARHLIALPPEVSPTVTARASLPPGSGRWPGWP